ncbi:MAG: ATP-dependent 6-phosphofructokinase [Candidatus Omnitrophota bacterium]|nr:ATP-dependent 6-phosphofructokinase [Candidatus Omnitrophota bacterium]
MQKAKTWVKRIGILTAGGDCPGLNVVIRAVTKAALHSYNIEVIGFRDGYDGLVRNNFMTLENRDVSGILTLGGTILGTSNTADPYRYAVKKDGSVVIKNMSSEAISNYRRHNLDALIVIGGDGTLTVASKLIKDGLNIVGVPKTIDNDLSETQFTFGFESAVVTATEAIDKLHSTAQSHHRVMIVELMGRYAGWIALYAGVAGGGDVILIPEIPYDISKVCAKLVERHRHGKRFSIVVVAEGARPKGGKLTVSRIVKNSPEKIRLGGVANRLAEDIEKMANLETRATILGHVQRGGTPTPFDRNLATLFGSKALELVIDKKFGFMAALKDGHMTAASIKKAIAKLKLVPADHPLLLAARDMNISFGDVI